MYLLINSNIFRLQHKQIISKWICVNCVRLKSSSESKTKTYSHTILSPKTSFPARANNAKKDEILKTAQFADLYKWQRNNLSGEEFVLHDGPPYANGDLHMGHAVNKIIKDINNRSQVLQGNRVHYIPGWDCHGLPIELKALQRAKKTSKAPVTDAVTIRKIARTFALETVERQKEAFKSWGVMADWDKQCYLTINKGYVKNQLRKFYELYKMGLIYRALKPVYWSPSSRTALAEAELEYDPQHKSKEVYVTFELDKIPDAIQNCVNGKPLHAIIWTTTPWTLVANRAICYNPTLKYSIVAIQGKTELFLVSSGSIEGLKNILNLAVEVVAEVDGATLSSTTYNHKLLNQSFPFLPGDHVTEGKGTGLVHTAPAHGPDDFLVGLKNGFTVECNVDEAGRYINLDQELNGLQVLKEGQDMVIKKLGTSVLFEGIYTHSYPLDWRTKQPVILRASQQWFIDTGALKNKALEALESVELLPPSKADQYRHGFKGLLESRPYWCISRQRAWGVPIPVLYRGDEAIVDSRIIDRLCELTESQGPDVWWTAEPKDLLPDDVAKEKGLVDAEITKGRDIMDIWLDSGVSWHILEGSQAKLYAEGVDQLTGWFQASLLTALPLTGKPPYKSIFVHGFVVDEKRRKMSKSIGNVIDPITIISGGRNKQAEPAYGVDTLRWWVVSHGTQHSQIVISKKFLDDCQSEVIRLRGILKYCLGVVNDLTKTDFLENPVLNHLDQYLVNECHEFMKNVNENYNNYRYNRVAQSILFFVSNQVSGLYCDRIKDRLYCSERLSKNRLSAQLVINTIFTVLCKSLAPVLPHLIEEAWQHHPLYEKPFFFTRDLPVLQPYNTESKLMDTVLEIKKDVCSKTEIQDLKRVEATLRVGPKLFDSLASLNTTDGMTDSVLCEILKLASVELVRDESVEKWNVTLSQSAKNQCLRCRKYNVVTDSDKCRRCEHVLSSL